MSWPANPITLRCCNVGGVETSCSSLSPKALRFLGWFRGCLARVGLLPRHFLPSDYCCCCSAHRAILQGSSNLANFEERSATNRPNAEEFRPLYSRPRPSGSARDRLFSGGLPPLRREAQAELSPR